MFFEATLPSDSFVDLDDILNTGGGPGPSNSNPRVDALQCITDLVDCCDAPRTVRGDWYFPDGTRVESTGSGAVFLVNRGPNEVIGQQQFNGSVRLFRRFSAVPERGRFRCELPNVANPNVNQILYANICEFITEHVAMCTKHYCCFPQ